MTETENETYLGDIIGNEVSEGQTFDKINQGIEKLGDKWIQENVGIYGCTIVANTLLTAKIKYRASVNGISNKMETKIHEKIKTLYVEI